MSAVSIESFSSDSRAVFDRAYAGIGRLSGCARWAAIAPGRVNLIGEHIDYNGGFVLPMAIDRACVAIASPARVPSACGIHALDVDERGTIDMTGPMTAPTSGPVLSWAATPDAPGGVARGSWLSYVAGVVAVYQREFGVGRITPVDLVLTSSVPLGGGLSSSASLELCVALLIERACGIAPDPRRSALLCQRAEHEFAGVPCGVMDQLVSATGQRDSACLIDCSTACGEAIPMPRPEHAVVVVINTNVRHELSTGEYAARRATCDRALLTLRLSTWREVTLRDVECAVGRLTDDEFRCARHVVTEIGRTLSAARALRSGPPGLAEFGRLMNESHESLRADYRVSCVELDTAAEIARSVPGVYGARMTGGGFGGCVIALVRPAAVSMLTASVHEGYRAAFGRFPTVFATTACAGARAVRLPEDRAR